MKNKLHLILKSLSVFIALTSTFPGFCADEKELLIMDDDWSVDSGGYVSEPYLLPILNAPRVSVLGLTVVTGDFWRQEEAASLLRFLEITKHGDIPVYLGAERPLLRTYRSDRLWQQKYGNHPWNGAWNNTDVYRYAHPENPGKIIAPLWGIPKIKPDMGGAVEFLIKSVHKYPGKVTIFTGGPLTTIALAVRIDPDFSSLVKNIVIKGMDPDPDRAEAHEHAPFNVMFDPEAAYIVLHEKWKRITILSSDGLITHRISDPLLTKNETERIKKYNAFIAEYMIRSGAIGLPMWSIDDYAYLTDPEVILSQKLRSVSVNIDRDANYGKTTFQDHCAASETDDACVNVVRIDVNKAEQDWLTGLR